MKDWWLKHVPYPFWASCNNPWWSPWCWLDDVCHLWFPMTFGWSRYGLRNGSVEHWPDREPWICRKHSRAAERYAQKHYPEYFK